MLFTFSDQEGKMQIESSHAGFHFTIFLRIICVLFTAFSQKIRLTKYEGLWQRHTLIELNVNNHKQQNQSYETHLDESLHRVDGCFGSHKRRRGSGDDQRALRLQELAALPGSWRHPTRIPALSHTVRGA